MTAVLFTCAGQRVDIVTAFRDAGATTIAADVDQLAPALYHAHRRALVPRVDGFGYVAALHDLVELHDVKPGITGWAQIHGRAALPWAERIELDLWYVRHRDWKTDLLILLRTPLALFGGTYKGATGGWR